MSKFPNPISFKFHHKAFEHQYQVPYVVELLDVEKSSSLSLTNYYIQRAQQFPNIYFYFATQNQANLVKVFMNKNPVLGQYYSFIRFPKNLEAKLRLFTPPFSIIVSENDVILNGGLGNSQEFYEELKVQNRIADMIIKDRTDRLPQLKNRQLLDVLLSAKRNKRSASVINASACSHSFLASNERRMKNSQRACSLQKASLPLLQMLSGMGIDGKDAVLQNYATGQALMYNARTRRSM